MITGSIPPDRQISPLPKRLWDRRVRIAILLFCVVLFGERTRAAVIHNFSLSYLGLPIFLVLFVGLSAWSFVTRAFVIPCRTIVWYRYDRPTFEYRRFGDDATHTFRTLDVLRIDARSDIHNQKGIAGYTIRLVSGARLVLDCQAIENGHDVAEQLAADIAHSPRWMFS